MRWILGRDRKLLRKKIVLQMTEHMWGRGKEKASAVQKMK
jgi:hypothetical protein